jgi:hypothetical protein
MMIFIYIYIFSAISLAKADPKIWESIFFITDIMSEGSTAHPKFQEQYCFVLFFCSEKKEGKNEGMKASERNSMKAIHTV